MTVRVTVTEAPNRVTAVWNGREHSAAWHDDQSLSNVVGDPFLLIACLIAWTGQEGAWEITPEDLEERGGGYWGLPEATRH
jgi:hypothetical protein